MSVFDVGTENLPNVYIYKMVVSNSRQQPSFGQMAYKISIHCLMKDHLDIKSWRGREATRDLNVKVALVYGQPDDMVEIIQGLNAGTDSLYNYKTDQENILVQIKNANDFVLERESVTENLCYYYGYFLFDFIMPVGSDVTAYTCSFVTDLGFGVDLFDKYYGPVQSDRILIGGEINENSGYFYFPETIEDQTIADKEYGGPVHYHSGEYMQGSAHTSLPHHQLRYVLEKDTKIIEERREYIVSGQSQNPVDPMGGLDSQRSDRMPEEQDIIDPQY